MSEERQCKILLVEDDPALARLMERKLRQAGCEVDAARSGQEGLTRAASGSYDALVVDYSLPDRDGLAVIRQLVASGCDLPTLMVTGSGSEEVAVEAMKLGVGDYIVKDIVGGFLSLLPLAIRRVIAQRQVAAQKRQIEKALEKERALTEVALNILPDLFYVFDADGRLLRWNNAARSVSGYSDEEIAAMKVTDAFLEEDRPRLEAAIQRTVDEGTATVEATFVAKDGTRRRFEMSGALLRDESGQPLAFCGFARNIDQRRKAEAALRANEKKLCAISESVLDAIIMIDSRGTIVHWNRAAEEMFGYSREEVTGKDVHTILAPSRYRAAAVEGITRFAKSGEGAAIGRILEMEAIRKDGSLMPVELAVSSVELEGQWSAVAVVRDISERKESQRKIVELSRFPDENPAPVLRVSEHGTILYGNPAAAVLFRDWQSGVGQSLPEDLCAIVREAIGSGVAHTVEVSCGQQVFALTLAPFPDTGYVNVYSYDITERKRIEEELRRLRKEASMGRLAAGILPETGVAEHYGGNLSPLSREAIERLGNLLKQVDALIDAAASGAMTDRHVADLEAARQSVDLDFLLEKTPDAIC